MKSSLLTRHAIRSGALISLLLALGMPAQALPGLDRAPGVRPSLPDNRPQLRPDLNASPERAVEIAERRYRGRAVGARHMGNGIYRVRILQDDGKVKTVTVRPE
jgi:hypothetical protein